MGFATKSLMSLCSKEPGSSRAVSLATSVLAFFSRVENCASTLAESTSRSAWALASRASHLGHSSGARSHDQSLKKVWITVYCIFSHAPTVEPWLPVSMYTVHQKFMQLAPLCVRLRLRELQRCPMGMLSFLRAVVRLDITWTT